MGFAALYAILRKRCHAVRVRNPWGGCGAPMKKGRRLVAAGPLGLPGEDYSSIGISSSGKAGCSPPMAPPRPPALAMTRPANSSTVIFLPLNSTWPSA